MLFLDLFYFNIVYYCQWCHLNRFRELPDNYQKSYMTQNKNLQIQNKVNLHGFSLWFERNMLFLDLFYFNIVYYCQWCHLNRFRELSDNYQKSYMTQSKNLQIKNKVNLYGFSLWSETNTTFLEVALFKHCSLPSMVSSQYVLIVILLLSKK